MTEEYSSALARCITGLIAQKRAGGFSYKDEAYMLRRFDALCISFGLEDESLPQGLAEKWSEQAPAESINHRNHRVSVLRQLALYMVSLGLDAYVPKLNSSWEKPAPYILNGDELVAIFQVIDSQTPHYRHPLRFIEAEKILFRMFYCCGLRLSEGLYLKRESVDLEKSLIRIIHSKGDKDRTVYLPDDLADMCRDYDSFIQKECPCSEWFFPGKDPCRPFAHSTFPVNFRRYWGQTPFSASSNRHPTIHSLRHTFVVDRMNDWMLNGVSLKAMLPYLSRYLGHSSVNDTLYYYHLVDKAFQVVRQKDRTIDAIIPEVTTYEE